MIRVLFGRQTPCDVTDDLKNQPNGKGQPPPAVVFETLRGVTDQLKKEPRCGKGCDGDGRCVPVDDNSGIIWSMGIGKIRVYIAK